MKKKLVLWSLIGNLLIAVLGTIAILVQILAKSANSGVNYNGWDTFRFFTNDGNIYCIIASIIISIVDVLILKNKKDGIPNWAYFVKLAAAVSGAIIFLVVMFILLPQMGFSILSGYVMFVLHVACPLGSVLTFIFLETIDKKVTLKWTVLGAIPVILYGLVSTTLCISKVWTGEMIPYPFLKVYDNPVWASMLYFIGILGGAWGLSVLFNFLNFKFKNRNNK